MMSKLESEIKGWHEKNRNGYLENYIAAFTQNQITYIISEYRPELPTLQELVCKSNAGRGKLLVLLRSLARSLNELANKREPASHGHLHPANVLVASAHSVQPC